MANRKKLCAAKHNIGAATAAIWEACERDQASCTAKELRMARKAQKHLTAALRSPPAAPADTCPPAPTPSASASS